MTDKEESKGVNIKIKGVMSSKVGLTDILGEVFHAIKVSDWKNERAKNNNAYVPTMKEHVANIFTHGVLTHILVHFNHFSPQVLVFPSVWLSWLMVANARGAAQLYCSLVYGAVLTGLFTVSTVFHTVAALTTGGLWRDLLHRSDRAMIYLFIAGSYTPWLQLRHLNGVSVELR